MSAPTEHDRHRELFCRRLRAVEQSRVRHHELVAAVRNKPLPDQRRFEREVSLRAEDGE